MENVIPPIVSRLAEQVRLTPIAWSVLPERVVIVFQEGAKITFDLVGSINQPADVEQTPRSPGSKKADPRLKESGAPVRRQSHHS